MLLSPEICLEKGKDILEKGKTDVFEIETTNIGKVIRKDYLLNSI